ncbi:hypothetical protein IAD21_01752 [Abditibacteriota bacterium]|nr:hypothetical protein IAD21_01752 [Abditibacteriota bacterium]
MPTPDEQAESSENSADENSSGEDENMVCCYVRDGVSHGCYWTDRSTCVLAGGTIVDDKECGH